MTNVSGDAMKVADCLLFLVGDRQAIERIASCRNAVWVGFLFVFLAAVAREYDQEYLVVRPWFLLIPACASLLVASVQYLLLIDCAGHKLKESIRRSGFRQFIALFWMTAPLAWLYAIPYESLLDEGPAVAANMWTLLVVAAWRVLLIIRVVNVLFGTSSKQSAAPILFVSDGILLAALHFLPVPLLQVMGGSHGSSAEEIIASTDCCVLALGWLTLPIWIGKIGTQMHIARTGERWQIPPPVRADVVVSRSTWMFAGLVLLLGVVPICSGQAKQRDLYQQQVRSEALPAEATKLAMERLRGLQRKRAWSADDERRIELLAEFGPWLESDGAQWIAYQTDQRVNFMLDQVAYYRSVLNDAPEFVAYLRRAQGTLRAGIDRELVRKILE